MRTQICPLTITWFILLDLPIVFIIILQLFLLLRRWSRRITSPRESSYLTIFHELCSWKIIRISEQVMPTYKHPIIFSPQVEAIDHILLFQGGERYHESKDLAWSNATFALLWEMIVLYWLDSVRHLGNQYALCFIVKLNQNTADCFEFIY